MKARESISSMMEVRPDGIVKICSFGTNVFVNREIETMFRREPGQIAGRTVETLVAAGPRARHAQRRSQLAICPDARAAGNCDLSGRREECGEFPARSGLSPIANGARVFSVMVDVSDRARSVFWSARPPPGASSPNAAGDMHKALRGRESSM